MSLYVDENMTLLQLRVGVLELWWTSGVHIDEPGAQTAVDLVNAWCASDLCRLLVVMTGTASVSRSARAVFARPSQASRIALVGVSPVDAVLVNFFLRRHTPPCPTQFFTSRDRAVNWLVEADDELLGTCPSLPEEP